MGDTCRGVEGAVIESSTIKRKDETVNLHDTIRNNSRQCRSPKCNADGFWAVGPNGKKIPLDRNSVVYAVEPSSDGTSLIAKPVRHFYVSHFTTCRDPDAFSSRKKNGSP